MLNPLGIGCFRQLTKKSFRVVKGPAFTLERKKKAAELTKEMLDSSEWQTTQFKVRGPSLDLDLGPGPS